MAADVGQDGYAVDEAMEDHYQAEQESSRPVVGEEASKPRGPPRKRRRIVISCTECHRRKQKVRTVRQRPQKPIRLASS